jgi:hypothetical protein
MWNLLGLGCSFLICPQPYHSGFPQFPTQRLSLHRVCSPATRQVEGFNQDQVGLDGWQSQSETGFLISTRNHWQGSGTFSEYTFGSKYAVTAYNTCICHHLDFDAFWKEITEEFQIGVFYSRDSSEPSPLSVGAKDWVMPLSLVY